jgi:hypothetical protein
LELNRARTGDVLAAPVGVHGADEKALRFARPHRPVTREDFEAGERGLVAARPRRALPEPGEQERVFAGVPVEPLAAAVGDLHQRLAQKQASLGRLARDPAPAELPGDADESRARARSRAGSA